MTHCLGSDYKTSEDSPTTAKQAWRFVNQVLFMVLIVSNVHFKVTWQKQNNCPKKNKARDFAVCLILLVVSTTMVFRKGVQGVDKRPQLEQVKNRGSTPSCEGTERKVKKGKETIR